MLSSPTNTSKLAPGDWRIRQRLVTYAAGGLALFGLYFFIRRIPESGFDITAIVLGLSSALMMFVVGWVRRVREHPGPAHVMCLTLFGAINIIAFGNGGQSAPAAEWFIVVAMLALFLVGPRTGIIYAIAAAISHASLFMMGAWELLPEPPDATYLAQDRLFSRITTITFVLFIGWRFAKERERASSALMIARDEINRILESLPVGVLVTQDNRIHSGNKIIRQLTEREPEDLKGRAVSDVLPIITEDITQQAGASAFHAVLLGPDQREISVRVSPVTVSGAQGGHLEVFSVEDLRHRNALEAQLRTSQRMASLGTLAAGVGHEINNPLSSLLGNLEFISETIASTPGWGAVNAELTEPLKDALDSTKRMAQTVRDLQIFSRGTEHKRALVPLDIGAVIRSAQRLARGQLLDVQLIEIHSEPSLQGIGSEPDLVRVLVNLLVNSAQAMREAESPARRITVRAYKMESCIEIRVSDSGPGMPADIIERIFDPFFTTKDVGKGTGLGLSICHHSMQTMNGSIRIESDGSSGATVILSIKTAPSAKPIATQSPIKELPPAPKAKIKKDAIRILVLDDEPIVSKAVGHLLGSDFHVSYAESGKDALLMLSNGGFDAILCDIMMPEMTGVEFFHKVRENFPELSNHVVFMTGGTFSQETNAFVKATLAPCLRKPIERALLRKTMREIST